MSNCCRKGGSQKHSSCPLWAPQPVTDSHTALGKGVYLSDLWQHNIIMGRYDMYSIDDTYSASIHTCNDNTCAALSVAPGTALRTSYPSCSPVLTLTWRMQMHRTMEDPTVVWEADYLTNSDRVGWEERYFSHSNAKLSNHCVSQLYASITKRLR